MSVSANDYEAPDGVREQLIQAARECFTRYGTEKTSMSDVARKVGLSRGTVYRYFQDRAGLIEAVFAYESHLMHADMRKRLDQLDTLEEQVVECAGYLASFEHSVATGERIRYDVSPDRLALMLTSHSEPMLRETIDFLVPYIAAAAERGEVRKEIDARQAAEWVARMLFSIHSMPAITFGGQNAEAWREFFREYALRGLTS